MEAEVKTRWGMANKEHLRILKEKGVVAWNQWRAKVHQEELRVIKEEGVVTWNKWRKANPDVEIDLEASDLRGAYLENAELSGANLRGAYLYDANLTDANLTDAKLQDVNLEGADLTGANLQGVNLTDADLSTVQALGTNFSGSILTGACIEDWNINNATNLNNVICDYIYLKEGEWNNEIQQYDFKERRPSDPNRNFESGEFVKLVEEYVETVDLIFKNGIDWRAFLNSFQDLQVEYGEQNVSIQAIEKKSDGAFVIRLNVPSEADKAEINGHTKKSYKTNLKVLEAKYRAELQVNDTEIKIYKQQSADMMEIVKLQANRPINVERACLKNTKCQDLRV